MISGEPEEAVVVGRIGDELFRAHFNRMDGCEIARWNRVRFLFPTLRRARSSRL
jgi:hypothetical protein